MPLRSFAGPQQPDRVQLPEILGHQTAIWGEPYTVRDRPLGTSLENLLTIPFGRDDVAA
jgi:hypothetical protein